MTDLHFEPFVHLAGLTHDDALIAWGGFWFVDPDRDGAGWSIVEDPDLDEVDPSGRRQDSIGVSSKPYGRAVVEVTELSSGEVVARAETSDANHAWLRGLRPDTSYRYAIAVDGRPWADGPRRDWLPGTSGTDLTESGRVYDTRFRTHPAPDTRAALRFAVLGDYGVGILASGGNGDRQRRLGQALERAVDHAGVRLVVTTGDNIYLGAEDTVAGTGNHDDDWYFSFYEPYRYAISRVPVYPGIGNHDSSDSEVSDNRDQLADNLFTDLRFAEGTEVGRASVDPGLFYRVQYGADVELIAIDTTRATSLESEHYVEHPRHQEFLHESFPELSEPSSRPRWRIPFTHHPPFCAGPKHGNAPHLVEHVVPLLERSGVRLMLSGHEHNFQHQQVGGVDYIVSGAAGKVREGKPDAFDRAGTRSWAAEGHLLVVDVDEDRITVHPVTDVDGDGRFTYLRRRTPDGVDVAAPIEILR